MYVILRVLKSYVKLIKPIYTCGSVNCRVSSVSCKSCETFLGNTGKINTNEDSGWYKDQR